MKKYAVNNEDLVKGLRSIAAPVRNGRGEVVAAVNIAVPSVRVTVKGLESTFAPQLLSTVQTISEVLGFRGDEGAFRPAV